MNGQELGEILEISIWIESDCPKKSSTDPKKMDYCLTDQSELRPLTVTYQAHEAQELMNGFLKLKFVYPVTSDLN